MLKNIMIAVGSVALLVVISVSLGLGGLEWNRFFAPKYENVRRDVFKSTRSFNEAKMQELSKYKLEYLRSNNEQDRAAIASAIRIAVSDYDTSKLPDELRSFVDEIKYK